MAESRYTSLLFQTTEYHRIGPFRFPIYHDLLPGEARALEDLDRKNAKSTFQSLKLAKAIAVKKGIRPSEAAELLTKLKTDDNDLIYEFAEEFEENQRTGISAIEQKAASVTCFMQLRGEAHFPQNPEPWVKTTDWSNADTDRMPTAMMESIWTFIQWEKTGWPEDGAAEGNAQPPSPSPTT